jgi:hypothetical protein
MPFSSAKTVTLQYHAMWKVDVNTGVVSYPTTKKRYATTDAEISRRSGSNTKRSVQKSKFSLLSSKLGLAWLSNNLIPVASGDEVVFRNVTGTGSRQWLSFHYTVNDPEGEYLF